MKHLVSLLFSLFVSVGLWAGESRSLEWYGQTAGIVAIPNFEGSHQSEGQALPRFFESLMPETEATSYRVQLTYPVYRKLTGSELKAVKPLLDSIPDSIQVSVSVGMERKKTVLDLSFLPFVRKDGSVYKLLSFNWQITAVETSLRSASALTYATSSVLSSGKWKKISVTESGIYKLTYSDIKNMGINPEKVQIYGYGGKLLAENFSLTGYMDDLPEVSVYKELGSDGVFNSGDYILFYAQGPVSWSYSTTYTMYVRTRNHYSDKAYYFVGERADGTRTASVSTYTGTVNKEVTSFTDYLLHETEKVNMGESVAGSGTGRDLFGEDFTTSSSQTFTFDVPNPDRTVYSRLFTEFAANNTSSTYCNVFVDDVYLDLMTFPAISVSDDYRYAYKLNVAKYFIPASENIQVQLDYYLTTSSSKTRANLDHITLNVRRYLKMTGSTMPFRDPVSVGAGNVGRFTLQNATSKLLVFDVTDPQNMVLMAGSLNADSYSFINEASTLHEYVAVETGGAISKPTIEGNVVNQDLHAKSGFDMVIVTPSEFVSYANQLAEAHVSIDGIQSLVVTPEQVYNEFSSGTPDATAIRRMMKLYYDRADGSADMPEYLLLFGDGVYDNRLVSTSFSNSSATPNKILTYQSAESVDGHYSYVTDDYFGFLDSNEGSSLGSAKLDIGIGRFTVSSAAEARIAVEKTLSYLKNARKGAWKNRLLFLADDGDSYMHVKQADALASLVGSTNPEFMINKIYVDTYTKVINASGTTVPDANTKFAELLNQGLLMLNYTGHGSTSQWADEKLLMNADIEGMSNKCLPLWVTATCDFTRYDASEKSGGERVFLKENGGGVALFTTTRIVYSSNNYTMNKCFIDNIFTKNNGVRYSLGEIMNRAKRSDALSGDANKLSFTLIGDPALKLGYPEYTAQVTEINGKAISSVEDTLQALSTITVSGEVYREDGTLASDFNGLITPTILDASEVIAKLGISAGDTLTIEDRSKVLFSGKDSVVNGQFSFTFVVPKDNSYSFENGRINLYAWDGTGAYEAQGNYDNFVIGGTDETMATNDEGPAMSLFLNDESFRSGGTVNETPTLIARVSDENGLNNSGNGIGHDLMLVIDDKSSLTFNLNNYYSADVGSYRSGVVRYQLPTLSAGKHHLTFRAWDVQNNSTTDTLYFQVQPGLEPEVGDIRFFQQGATSYFRFLHDRPQADVIVLLSVYDLLGRVVWQTEWSMQAEDNYSDLLEWNLTDTNERRIANGVYLCRIQVSDSNGSQTYSSKKIMVTGQ
jgi:hypothetical protein